MRPAPRCASDRERLHLQPGLQAAPSEKPGLPAVEELEGAKLRWESGSRSPRGGQGQVVVECLRLQQLRQQRPRGKETVSRCLMVSMMNVSCCLTMMMMMMATTTSRSPTPSGHTVKYLCARCSFRPAVMHPQVIKIGYI